MWSNFFRTTPRRTRPGKARETIDNAQMRYFIVHLHRLLDPGDGDGHAQEGLNLSVFLGAAEGISGARIITRQALKAGFRLDAILLHLLDQVLNRIEFLVGADEIDEFHQQGSPIQIFIHLEEMNFKNVWSVSKVGRLPKYPAPPQALEFFRAPSRTRTV